MSSPGVRLPAVIVRPPLHRLLALMAAFCFIATLLTDVSYAITTNIMWVDFSDWLVTAGAIIGWGAFVIGLIACIASRLVRALTPLRPYVIGNVLALILGTLDMLVHTRDAWTSVVPWGLVLSAATVIVLLLTGWLSWSTASPYRVGATA